MLQKGTVPNPINLHNKVVATCIALVLMKTSMHHSAKLNKCDQLIIPYTGSTSLHNSEPSQI